jgi:hypothetical protein
MATWAETVEGRDRDGGHFRDQSTHGQFSLGEKWCSQQENGGRFAPKGITRLREDFVKTPTSSTNRQRNVAKPAS